MESVTTRIRRRLTYEPISQQLRTVKLEPDDWVDSCGNNNIPDGMVNENLFFGLHHGMHLDMRASLMKMFGDTCVPTIGLMAERRTLSALAALRSSVGDDSSC